MATKKETPKISPERVEEIKRDARSGRNWAEEYARRRGTGLLPPAVLVDFEARIAQFKDQEDDEA